MKQTRRNFLKMAGAAAAAAAVAPASKALASYLPHYIHVEPNHDALQAKRWGMVIDTRKFHGHEDFKPLIEACHKYHNVPDISGKKEIKWLWTDHFHAVFPSAGTHMEYLSHDVEEREYLLMCNQCKNPPCVRVCPTKATYQREDGIVIMDMHRCIGCRFCMAACPYGSRSFNFQDPRPFIAEQNTKYPTRMKGVVEKCNFCAERLAEGLMPACVEASNGKLVFGDLEDPDSDVRHALAENFTIRRKPELGTGPSVFYII